MAESQGPDEAAFREDLEGGFFLAGAARGDWSVLDIVWPAVQLFVRVPKRGNGPDRFCFQLDCAGYPDPSPTATLWDREGIRPLPPASWPKGRARVKAVFRTDWKQGRALYHPFDRVAMASHGHWREKYPGKLWTPYRTIGDWIAEFHELLNSDEFTGT